MHADKYVQTVGLLNSMQKHLKKQLCVTNYTQDDDWLDKNEDKQKMWEETVA